MKPEVQQVLVHLTRPSKATRRSVQTMLGMPDEALIEALIQKNRMEVTAEDFTLLERTQQNARAYIKRGAHHVFCNILDEDGKFHPGIQETFPRDADCESCAEAGAISHLDVDRAIPKTACTVHFMPIPQRGDGGATTIVSPCLRCAGRFRHLVNRHNHNFGVIVHHNKEVIKVSALIAHLLPYPQGYFYGNGDEHHKP